MGLCIALETDDGHELITVADDKNILHRLLPAAGSSNAMLASVDWYGDTVFNNLQMRQFLPEWADLTSRAATPEEEQFLMKVKDMALRCRDEVHLYLRFIGD
jgi:hypothetical protein